MLLTPEERRAGIGGSDVGAIMGANPYCSPIKLYKEKKGEVAPPSLNHAMEWGNILEDVIAKKYAENNNLFFCEGQRLELPDPSNYMGVVYKPSIVRGGPDGAIACEWAYAHPDFYEEVKGELSGIEVKTVSEGMYRKYWAEGEIPPWQYYQVVWYSILTGVEKWTLLGFAPHLRLSADPLLAHDLFIDADTQHRVLEKVKEFWECLESDTIPHVDKLGNNDIKLLYPENTMDMVQSSSSIDFQVKRLYAVVAARSIDRVTPCHPKPASRAGDCREDPDQQRWNSLVESPLRLRQGVARTTGIHGVEAIQSYPRRRRVRAIASRSYRCDHSCHPAYFDDPPRGYH